MSKFGGVRGPQIEKSLYEIEDSFENLIGTLKTLTYDVLDITSTLWHEDYTRFKNAVKDLEVKILFFLERFI